MPKLITRSVVFVVVAALFAGAGFLVKKYLTKPSDPNGKVEIIVRPNVRPDRLDLDLISQYAGQPMDQVLGNFEAQSIDQIGDKSAAATLLSSLPDEPFPFPEGATPANEIALKQFVQSIEGGQLGDPSMVDRWRYNLASAALGKSGDSIPEELRLKTIPRIKTENFPVKLVPKENDLEAPLAIADFDGIAGMEIISHGGTRISTFSEEGLLKPLQGLEGTVAGASLIPADYDQDGDLDLFVTRRFGIPNSLLQNDGRGNFNDVTVDSGLLAFSDTATAAWTDYDQDGLIDLLVGNFDHPFELYRQESAGVFKPVSWELDMWIPNPVREIKVGDINLDGYPDLILSISGMVDKLLYSIPSIDPLQWRFLEKGEENNLPFTVDTQAIATFDLDNDGDLDLLLGKSSGDSEKRISSVLNDSETQPENHLRLFINDGEGGLTDVTEGSGLDGVEDVQAIHVMDIDHDGFEDIFAVTGDLAFNRTFWNRGGFRFREVSRASGLNYLNSPGKICSVDIDTDGAIDLFLSDHDGKVNWLEGQVSNGWLALNLENSPPGTRIKVLARDTDWILQPIQRVTGMIPSITIGLGQIDKIEQIEVFTAQSIEPVKTLTQVQPNQIVNINVPEKNSQIQSKDKTPSQAPPGN
jgi:hypothetical protein